LVADRPADGPAIRLNRPLGDRARDILAGRVPPAPARDAATVMLLRPARPAGQGQPDRDQPDRDQPDRDQPDRDQPEKGQPQPGKPDGGQPDAERGIEVYMLRRQPSMAFAPGASVFPGGSVDARDADADVAWAGPDAAAWGQVFDAPDDLARALVCAAVRETFEECGILLAGPTAAEVVADTSGDDWESDRRALLERSISLAGLLGQRHLVLRADLLTPWSRWITPIVEERRFDARFFAAALPPGQRTRDVGGEAAQVAWVRPAAAIAAGRAGEITLWPPTEVTLAQLAEFGTVAAALAAPRQVRPLLPEVTLRGGTPWLTVPGVRDYPW
jgi:8-oxo-dGTP pyrophosphatase MutT (NUDIX family)